MDNCCKLARADAVKVKPLVWWETASQNNHTHGARCALCALGTYYVHVDGGRHQAWLETFNSNSEIWCGEVCGSVDAAKAAAQADYEARILAALEPTPSAPSPETPFITSAHREGYLVCLPPRGPAKLSFATPSAPSPEAVARAALEWAAKCIECGCRHGVCEYPAKCPENDVAELVEAASDPATLAAIIAKAGDAAI